MIYLFFLLLDIALSLSPSYGNQDTLRKVEFLRDLYTCHREAHLGVYCHMIAEADFYSNLYKNYNLLARYQVGDEIPEVPMADIINFPEDSLEDYWIVVIFRGDHLDSLRRVHTLVYYRKCLIEKFGRSFFPFIVSSPVSTRRTKWINRKDFYFLNKDTRQLYKYIYLELLSPKDHFLKKRQNYSFILDFILNESKQLNALLSESDLLLTLEKTQEQHFKKGDLIGWNKVLKRGLIQKHFPYIESKMLTDSLNGYTEYTSQLKNRPPFQFSIYIKNFSTYA